MAIQPYRLLRLLLASVAVGVLWPVAEGSAAARPRPARHGTRHHGCRTGRQKRKPRRRCPRPAHLRLLPAAAPVAQPSQPAPLAPQPFQQAEPGVLGASAPLVPFRFFSSGSFWNAPVAVGAALDPSSEAVVGEFAAQVEAEGAPGHWPWINTSSDSVPVYTVPAGEPTTRVSLEAANAPALQAAWGTVPLPAAALPAAGPEGVLVVYQPSSDQLWEFWRLAHTASGWAARWGGAMQDASQAPGVYGPGAWPGGKTGWGVSASSLSLVGGLITLEDLRDREINHAVEIAVPRVRAGVFASPAQRTDGRSSNPLALPEGAHLRLDPTLDLETLGLPPVTLMIARAVQRYGMFVRDYSPNVAFYAQDPTPTGTDPYDGPTGYFEGRYPRELLAGFPWKHLRLLKMQLHAQP